MKKLLKTLVLALCLIGTMALTGFAASAEQFEHGTEKKKIDTVYVVNPVYSDLFTEEDIRQMVESQNEKQQMNSMQSGSVTYCTTIAEAGVVLKKAAMSHQLDCTVYYVQDYFSSAQPDYKAMISAMEAHTKVPTEGDYIKWQYSGYSITGECTDVDSNYQEYWKLNFTFTRFYDTMAEEKALNQKVQAFLDTYYNPGDSVLKKVQTIYNWITANVTYDYSEVAGDYHKYTAYAGMVRGTCVCQGYSLLMYRLCLEMGVDCRVVVGYGGGNHAWNLVKMGDGKWYFCDSTWDAGKANKSYFLKGSDEFFYDHFIYDDEMEDDFEKNYPYSATDYNYSFVDKSEVPTLKSVTNSKEGYQKVTWDNSSNFDEIYVYRKSGSGSYSKVANIDASYGTLDVAINTPVSGTVYTYCLKGYKNGSTSGKSNEISVTYLALTTPKAVTTASGINVSWATVKGATSYQVYRKTAEETSYTKIAATKSLSYLDKDVLSTVKFSYRIRPVKGGTNGVLSRDVASAMYLKAPQIDKVDNQVKSQMITWSNSTGAKGYYVYCKENDGSYVRIAQVAAAASGKNQYVNSNVKSGTRYTYTIKSYNGSNVSGARDGVTNMFLAPATITTGERTNPGMKISWNKVNGADYYIVYRIKSGAWSKIGTTRTLSFTDTDTLKAGVGYMYSVRAINGSYYSKNGASPKTLKPVNDTIRLTSLKNTSAGISMSWKTVAGADTYYIYRKESGKSFALIGKVGKSGTTYVDASVKGNNGKMYEYAVKPAFTGSLGCGVASKMVRLWTQQITFSNVNKASNCAQVSWNNNAAADGYEAYYQKKGSSEKVSITYNGTGFYLGDYVYTFRVRSYKIVDGVRYYGEYAEKTLDLTN